MCAKGLAALVNLYDPERLTKPLKRTNPEKGVGVDPKWVEVDWDQALAEIGERLSKVRNDDPRKLVFMTFDTHAAHLYKAWMAAFGSPNYEVGTPNYFCGNNVHPFTYLAHAAFFMEPDLEYCNYLILMGCQFGHGTLSNAMDSANRLAKARERGLKLVVVDPVCSRAAGKADEWLPIRPGTDAAFALGLLNQVINELGAHDKTFLKTYTNSPYLVKNDGSYMRDPETGKPLVWDAKHSNSRPFDSPEPADVALEGVLIVNDEECRPSFELLKNHLKTYTPEKVASITTIPADTIRRIAKEYAQAANAGTVTIGGQVLPLRPAAVLWNRGPSQHKHAMLTGLAMYLLNIVMGAVDVPGGILGSNPVGPWWKPGEDSDGILLPSSELSKKPIVLPTIYPPAKVKAPTRISLRELFPVAPYSGIFMIEALLEPEKYKLPYKPEVLFFTRTNPILSGADPSKMIQALTRIPFIVAISGKVDETAELADYVLPDPALLELLLPFANRTEKPMGGKSWFFMMAQPVMEPRVKYRHQFEILYRLAEKAGFLGDLNETMNSHLDFKDPYKLQGAHPYTWEEISDLWLKSWFGEEHGLNWFKQNGLIILRDKQVNEIYQRPFNKGRSLIYLEHMKRTKEAVSEVLGKMGLQWDLSDYQSLPDWKPCPSYSEKPSETLYLVNFKVPEQALSTGYTLGNPLLHQLTERSSGFSVLINTETASRLGISEGNRVTVESEFGYQAEAVVHLTEGIHPEVLGVAGAFGHWAKKLGIAHGKGIHWNSFIPISIDRIDMVSAAVDTCVKVSIRKEPAAMQH